MSSEPTSSPTSVPLRSNSITCAWFNLRVAREGNFRSESRCVVQFRVRVTNQPTSCRNQPSSCVVPRALRTTSVWRTTAFTKPVRENFSRPLFVFTSRSLRCGVDGSEGESAKCVSGHTRKVLCKVNARNMSRVQVHRAFNGFSHAFKAPCRNVT